MKKVFIMFILLIMLLSSCTNTSQQYENSTNNLMEKSSEQGETENETGGETEMYKVTDNLYQLSGMRAGQVYLIIDGSITLVDTGFENEFDHIAGQLQSMNLKTEDIDNIILTHGHRDHAGSLEQLLESSNGKLYIHRGETDIIDKLQNKFSLVILNEGDIIPVLGGFKVIHIPGHTDGLMSLYSPEYKILISGDSIFNNNNQPSLPPVRFNSDTEMFMENVKKLQDYDIEIICPGHGPVIMEKGNDVIDCLLK